MTKQPEAVILAHRLALLGDQEAAAELRRLHAVNAELLEVLETIVDHLTQTDNRSIWHLMPGVRAAIAKATGEKE